ncbi:hypothetical protein FRC0190_02100 [Corynebacterium rouxii]|uniref:Uncharacterized protein n=1 Tax=Corynebacterium rouxii TaxID=2719119 RepID=A0A6I8MIA2_9CORY|nr:hypothetical protein FRC0190_02100 [Corynebacterium rouxii]
MAAAAATATGSGSLTLVNNQPGAGLSGCGAVGPAWTEVEVNSASFCHLGINVDFWELIRVLISSFSALECIATDGNRLNAIDLAQRQSCIISCHVSLGNLKRNRDDNIKA